MFIIFWIVGILLIVWAVKRSKRSPKPKTLAEIIPLEDKYKILYLICLQFVITDGNENKFKPNDISNYNLSLEIPKSSYEYLYDKGYLNKEKGFYQLNMNKANYFLNQIKEESPN